LYRIPGVAETVKVDQIKIHYYYTHERLNPTRIVPIGPDLEYLVPPVARGD
jgi:putative glutathione S-transferase